MEVVFNVEVVFNFQLYYTDASLNSYSIHGFKFQESYMLQFSTQGSQMNVDRL